MTVQKAIEWCVQFENSLVAVANTRRTEALSAIQKCRQALEKQISITVKRHSDGTCYCNVCGNTTQNYQSYCEHCGQALDWGD